MWAWVRSCPLKAKLPGGAWVARVGPIVPASTLTSDGVAQPAVGQDRQHRHRAAEVVGHQQVTSAGMHADISRAGAAGAHGVEQLQSSVGPIDGKGADGALLVVAHPIGLIGGIEAGSRGIQGQAARARAHLDDAASASSRRWCDRPGRDGCRGRSREADPPGSATCREAGS